MHQAGIRNAVGLMGTALTGEQVSELARMARRVLLALDADAAGQEAMLRAARAAASRRLELRVVPMPAGTDPAELIQREGGEAMREAVERSVPFVRFRVENALESGSDSSPEGRDRLLEELRPVFATVPPSAMRMELTRIVSGRLALPESVVERMLAGGPSGGGRGAATGAAAGPPRPAGGGGRGNGSGSGGGLARREEMEHAFLSLCIASPAEGTEALAELDIEEDLSGALARRAARHLLGAGLEHPLGDVEGERPLEEDPQVKGLLAELVVVAGRGPAREGMLRVQRLQLELARLDRQIARARGGEGSDVAVLARRKGEVQREFDTEYARVLEETGPREG
jgi:DNA primase